MNKIASISTPLLIAASLVVGGCAQEEEEEAPPSLPLATSMSMDMSALTSAPNIAKTDTSTAVGDHANFANAYTRVVIVDVIAVALVVLPATAIALAINQPAERQNDGSYHWTVTALGTTADVFVAHSLGEGWTGELYITNDTHSNYLWVEGAFTTDLTNGTWTLHDSTLAAGADVSLEIDWDHRAVADYSLTYRNANTQNEGFGDTMDFTLVGQNASLVYTDASAPSQVATIVWDTVTAAGGMQVPEFNGGEEACWDAAFLNTSCK